MNKITDDTGQFKNNKAAADLMISFIEFGEDIELEARYILNKNTVQRKMPYKFLMYNMLIAKIRLQRSIFYLLKEGEPMSALLVLRTLFEILVQYLYIKINPVKYSINYMQFSYWQIKKLHEKGFGYINVQGSKDTEEWLEQTKKQFETIETKFLHKKKPFTWWHGMRFVDICKKVDSKWPGKYDLEKMYNGLYGFLSIESHGGPLSLGKLVNGEFGNLEPRLESESIHQEVITGLVCNFTYEYYRIFIGVYNLRKREKLNSLKKSIDKFVNKK